MLWVMPQECVTGLFHEPAGPIKEKEQEAARAYPRTITQCLLTDM